MDEFRFEQLTVGLLFKREGGMFKSSGLGVFYDPTKKEKENVPLYASGPLVTTV